MASDNQDATQRKKTVVLTFGVDWTSPINPANQVGNAVSHNWLTIHFGWPVTSDKRETANGAPLWQLTFAVRIDEKMPTTRASGDLLVDKDKRALLIHNGLPVGIVPFFSSSSFVYFWIWCYRSYRLFVFYLFFVSFSFLFCSLETQSSVAIHTFHPRSYRNSYLKLCVCVRPMSPRSYSWKTKVAATCRFVTIALYSCQICFSLQVHYIMI